jgi:hypothetical protein
MAATLNPVTDRPDVAEHYRGYFIGSERHVRPATADDLASGYHKFRVHVFADAASALAWQAADHSV